MAGTFLNLSEDDQEEAQANDWGGVKAQKERYSS